MYSYTPRGVCSREIRIDLDGDQVSHVEFVGGCDGNLKAVSKLIEGMTVEEVAAVLEGATPAVGAPRPAPTSWCGVFGRRVKPPNRPKGRGIDRGRCRSPMLCPCARDCWGRGRAGVLARRFPSAR